MALLGSLPKSPSLVAIFIGTLAGVAKACPSQLGYCRSLRRTLCSVKSSLKKPTDKWSRERTLVQHRVDRDAQFVHLQASLSRVSSLSTLAGNHAGFSTSMEQEGDRIICCLDFPSNFNNGKFHSYSSESGRRGSGCFLPSLLPRG